MKSSFLCTLALLALCGFLGGASLPAQENKLTLNAVPEGQRSEHFMTAVSKLDIGGDVFEYRDLEDPINAVVDLLSGVTEAASTAEGIPPLGPTIVKDILRDLGFLQFEAYGHSSYYDGAHHVNRWLYLTEDAPKGLASVLGASAKAYNILELAPAGSDLVVEFEVNVPGAYISIRNAVSRVAGVVGVASMEAQMKKQQVLPNLTGYDLLTHMDFRFGYALDLEGEFRIEDGEILPPAFHDIYVLNGDRALISALKTVASQNLGIKEFADRGGLVIGNIPVPPDPELKKAFPQLNPAIAFTPDGKTAYFTTDLDWFMKVREGGEKLAAQEDFSKLYSRVPREGNMLVYRSAKLAQTIYDGIDTAIEAEQMGQNNLPAEVERMSGLRDRLLRALIGSPDKSMISSVAVGEDGIYAVALTPNSLEAAGTGALAATAGLFLGYSSFRATPEIKFTEDFGVSVDAEDDVGEEMEVVEDTELEAAESVVEEVEIREVDDEIEDVEVEDAEEVVEEGVEISE